MPATRRDVIERWKSDPDYFLHSIGSPPIADDQQRAVWQSVIDHQITGVPSGHGTGKDWLAARIAVWFLMTRGILPCYIPGQDGKPQPDHQAVVLTSAPNDNQLDEVLWGEVRRTWTQAKEKLPDVFCGSIQPAGHLIRPSGDRRIYPLWFMTGTVSKTIGGITGRHPAHIMVIADEATELTEEFWTAVPGLMTSLEAKVLAIGQPFRTHTGFHRLCQKPGTSLVRMDSRQTANYLSGTNRIPGMATREWVAEMRRECGEGSALWLARVEGRFPPSNEDQTFPSHWLDAAEARDLLAGMDAKAVERLEASLIVTRRMGVDVGRGVGADRSVVVVRDRLRILDVFVSNELDERGLASKVRDLSVTWGVSNHNIIVDNGDSGPACIQRLADWGIHVVKFLGGGRARRSSKFANARAECYWSLRDAIDPKGTEPFSLHGDVLRDFRRSLREELDAQEHEMRGDRLIAMVSKDSIKAKLGGRSPDIADALAMSFVPTVRTTNLRADGPMPPSVPAHREIDRLFKKNPWARFG